MNLSQASAPAHSYAAPKPKSYVGVGLVMALHLAGIYALSAGLIQPPARERPVTEVRALPPDTPKPPEPVERLKAAEPNMQPQRIVVPEPINDFVVATDRPVVGPTVTSDPTSTVIGTGPTGSADTAPPQRIVQPLVQTPGAVCSTMPRPEVPAVNWSGEAVLQVLATVRGGRVVGTEFRVMQGAPDGKTRRSLQRSVESALAGYQCQGDATFQQDFAFRLD